MKNFLKFLTFCVMILLAVLIIYAGKYAIKEKEEIPDEYKQTDISILSNLRDSAGAGVVKESDSQADKQAREAMQTDHTAELPVLSEQNMPDTIRVLLSDDGSYWQSEVRVSSDSDIRVICGQTETSYKKGTEIDLVELTGDADPVSLTIIPEQYGKLTIESFHKSEGAPSYRGKLQIKKQENKYCIVNELAFEEYLYAVVSSEMPSSYEKEALKAQAVCARSYAVRRIQDGAFEEYGADLDDTTASQVYNNVFETEETIHAVQETEGQILTNDGDVVNAYFFSTSCGTTCRNDDVWGGEKLDYLNDQLEIYTEADRKRLGDATVMLDHGYFQIGDGRLSTEEVFRAFIDQTVYVNSIEKEEPFYRWQVTLTADQIQTLAGADITDQTGEIEKVRITKRGNSGIVRNMVLYGKQSSVTIEGQMEIRELLCSPDVVIRKQDGSETSGFDLLPSAYFYITQDKEGNYQLHGGGFGHGVGMSQNGANDLAEAGYGYEEILSHYYNGTELEKLRETGNKTNEE